MKYIMAIPPRNGRSRTLLAFPAITILNCSKIGYVTLFYGKAVKHNCFYERLFFEI